MCRWSFCFCGIFLKNKQITYSSKNSVKHVGFLTDGKKDAHDRSAVGSNPYLKIEFGKPTAIDEIIILNCPPLKNFMTTSISKC